MGIYEIHYICKYNPIYNREHKTDNVDLFDLPELNWEIYILKSFIDDCRMHFIMVHGEDDFYSEFQNNKDFHSEVLSSYLSNNTIHRRFASYEYDDILYN